MFSRLRDIVHPLVFALAIASYWGVRGNRASGLVKRGTPIVLIPYLVSAKEQLQKMQHMRLDTQLPDAPHFGS
jgi:hypothetical protein